jgi:spore coat polysaccharide biosynthesis protein SpsF
MVKEIDAIIQARLDSERLPQKVILPIDGKPLIAHIVERLSRSKYLRNIIIATTEDSLALISTALKGYDRVKFFVGSKENVLERYYLAAKTYEPKIIVRATGDNPLVCPVFMDNAIELHTRAEADLTHFLGIPLGTGVEIINRDAVNVTYKNTKHAYDREHVTPFIYKNRDSFKVFEPLSAGPYYAPDVRVTVDTRSDLETVRKVFEHYHEQDYISMEDIISFFKRIEEEREEALLEVTAIA